MKDFNKDIISIDESAREIAALDELYSDIIKTKATDGVDLSLKKEEANFARERILRLSLHIKRTLEKMS